jgi:hypothetical protein
MDSVGMERGAPLLRIFLVFFLKITGHELFIYKK